MDVMKKVPVREQAPDVRNKILMKFALVIMQKRHRKKQHVVLIVRIKMRSGMSSINQYS